MSFRFDFLGEFLIALSVVSLLTRENSHQFKSTFYKKKIFPGKGKKVLSFRQGAYRSPHGGLAVLRQHARVTQPNRPGQGRRNGSR